MNERDYFTQEELEARAKAVQADLTHIFMQIGDVHISDILNKDFLEKNTNFHNFLEMKFSSMVWIDWDKEVVTTRKSLLDRFIAGSSRFATWDEMYQTALADYEERTGKSMCSSCEHGSCSSGCHYGIR